MRKRLLVLFLVLVMMLDIAGIASPALPVSQSTEAQAKKRKTYVYITPTGSCYHRKVCGRGSYYKVTLKEAKSLGLRKCRRCYR